MLEKQTFPFASIVIISDATAIASGISEYSVVFDGRWLGKNGKWYSLNWGGNQWTGGRSLALSAAEFWKVVTKGAFVVSAGVNIVDAISAGDQGDGIGVATAVSNIGWAGAGTFGGSVGFAGAASYTVTTWLLKVPGVYDVVITAPLDFLCDRSTRC